MNLWQSMGQISQGLLRSKDFVPHTTIPAPRMLERRLQSGSDPLLAEAEELGGVCQVPKGRWKDGGRDVACSDTSHYITVICHNAVSGEYG